MATIPSESRVLNTLFTYTMDEYAEDSTKNMLTSNVLVDLLYKNGKAKIVDGGARIDFAVQYGFNPGAQWYAGADVLDMTPYELATTAKYDWKNIHAPITYTGEQARKNKGAAAKANIVQETISNTETTLYKVLEMAMVGDGTGNQGKVILGLDAMFPVTATADPAAGSIGGITAVGNPFWQNFSVSGFGSWAANGPGGTAADLWLNTWNTISDGPDTPDLVLSSQDVFERYVKSGFQFVQIIMQKSQNLDLSFPTVTYMGKPWSWSRVIATGRAYMLRIPDIEVWVHRDANMTLSEFQKSFNQDLYGASMITMLAFFVRRRIFSAVIDGIVA